MKENNPKWIIPSIIILILITAIAILGYYLDNSKKEVACTLEAKICPDGSSVGRSGPNCEFTKCPTNSQE